jgi:hypothetical protein
LQPAAISHNKKAFISCTAYKIAIKNIFKNQTPLQVQGLQSQVRCGDPARLGFDELESRAGRGMFEFHVMTTPFGFEGGETFEFRVMPRAFDLFVYQ